MKYILYITAHKYYIKTKKNNPIKVVRSNTKILPYYMDYNFLSRNCHKESLITSRCHYFLLSISQPINLEYKVVRTTK
jgi:hypothetical protein